MSEKRQTILIIDDTPINIRVLSDLFEPDCEIVFATNGADGIRMAHADRPDLILLDIMMPKMDGYEVCRRLKLDPITRDIPVVFVSALGEEKDEAKGLELGAIDYIVKPVTPLIVKARIRNHLELKRHRDMLASMATIDGLTGIANRRRFDEILQMEWHRSQRAASPISVLMIDIDHFKLYNDRYGHLIGDDCLKSVASVMSAVVKRPGDLLARYGGEEFACVLSETDTNGALFVARQLIDSVAGLKIVHEDSQTSPVITVSIGFCSTIPTSVHTSSQLVDCADQNLYKAKKAGRNRVYLCDIENCDLSCCILEKG